MDNPVCADEGFDEAAGEGSPAEHVPAPPFGRARDVISPMLAVYRKHFTLVGILVLVTTVPQALLQYGALSLMNGAGTTVLHVGVPRGPAMPAGVGSITMLFWPLRVAGSALLSGSLVYAVVELQRAGAASAGESLARGLKALPRLFLVSLLYSVIVVLGYVMLIMPGVVFSLMFAVCVPVAAVEGRGVMESLKRSYALTDGRKGLLFVTYFLWGLLILVLDWVVVWSFARGTGLDPLPATVLQAAIIGMLNSSVYVLTVYIYLGLLRERRGAPAAAGAFTD
jgi:hypothetical protein